MTKDPIIEGYKSVEVGLDDMRLDLYYMAFKYIFGVYIFIPYCKAFRKIDLTAYLYKRERGRGRWMKELKKNGQYLS